MHWPTLAVIKCSHNESYPLILKRDVFPQGREMTYMHWEGSYRSLPTTALLLCSSLKACQTHTNLTCSAESAGVPTLLPCYTYIDINSVTPGVLN